MCFVCKIKIVAKILEELVNAKHQQIVQGQAAVLMIGEVGHLELALQSLPGEKRQRQGLIAEAKVAAAKAEAAGLTRWSPGRSDSVQE
jgi:hypothetical protein